jgi:hypothetical protein
MLTTVASVKASLQSQQGVNETLIARLIKQVGARIEAATERWWEYAAREETLNGRASEYLYLRGAGIVADSVTVTVDGTELVEDTDYYVDYETGELWNSNGWEADADRKGVVVEYTAGYGYTDAGVVQVAPPVDLEGAVIAEVVAFHDTFKAGNRSGQDLVDIKTPFLTKAVQDFVAANKLPRYNDREKSATSSPEGRFQ